MSTNCSCGSSQPGGGQVATSPGQGRWKGGHSAQSNGQQNRFWKADFRKREENNKGEEVRSM